MSKPVDVRLEVERTTVDVLDGYCSASGKCRNKVINEILLEWAEGKRHEAMMICRVAGINPANPDRSGT